MPSQSPLLLGNVDDDRGLQGDEWIPNLVDRKIANIVFVLWACVAVYMGALRVLVIEDDALIAMLLTQVLAGLGHEVCATAATEDDAVVAASRNRPDLIIADAALGRGSGVSAVEQILHATGPLAHVFISGDAGRVRELKPGAVVIRKPFREAELITAIDAALYAVARPQV